MHLSFIPLVFLTTCHIWNFYPDPDDKGLSRFTSRGYNNASNYINDRPFVNNGPYDPLLHKDSTGNSMDTLVFSWALRQNDSVQIRSRYSYISFLMPIPSIFNKNNFMAFNGKRFLSVPLTIRDTLMKTMTGDATLYFVSVSEEVLLLIPILSLLSYPVFLMEILEILL
ncbi:MAG TPA: hypothetical protein VN726_15620 [Hanamia sp.]|nr:hypothetical protein [Hanamia sp.]